MRKSLDGFLDRFEQRYGKGSLDKFKDMIARSEHTLSEVGRYFGFTKEYARVVYKNIYGIPYTEILQKKKEGRRRLRERLRQDKIIEERLKSKRFISMNKAIEKLRGMGFSPLIESDGKSFQLLLNGHKIAVRSSKAFKCGMRRYFHFFKTSRGSDFLICLCHNEDETFYVIPAGAIPESGINIAAEQVKRSKYSLFKEAWNLLSASSDAEVIN